MSLKDANSSSALIWQSLHQAIYVCMWTVNSFSRVCLLSSLLCCMWNRSSLTPIIVHQWDTKESHVKNLLIQTNLIQIFLFIPFRFFPLFLENVLNSIFRTKSQRNPSKSERYLTIIRRIYEISMEMNLKNPLFYNYSHRIPTTFYPVLYSPITAWNFSDDYMNPAPPEPTIEHRRCNNTTTTNNNTTNNYNNFNNVIMLQPMYAFGSTSNLNDRPEPRAVRYRLD